MQDLVLFVNGGARNEGGRVVKKAGHLVGASSNHAKISRY